MIAVVALLSWCLMTSAAEAGGAAAPEAPLVSVDSYEVVASFPHDPRAFTQGLVFEKGYFFESTGLYGDSSLRKVDVLTGAVVRQHDLPDKMFGEGLALYEDRLIQLTWRSGKGFVYDKDRFVLLREFSYSREGWGLTFDGRQLIMSDGSSLLYLLDPDTLAEVGTIEVQDRQRPVFGLNELEFVRGEILANVLPTDRVARIDPHTGHVTGWINLGGLLSVQRPNPAGKPLNGIAYDSEKDRLFVTGKLWPKVFEIKVVPMR